MSILRENADKHLAFGIGRHTCLGKPVALMQLKEFYSQFGEGSTFPQVKCDEKNLGGCVDTIKFLKEHQIV